MSKAGPLALAILLASLGSCFLRPVVHVTVPKSWSSCVTQPSGAWAASCAFCRLVSALALVLLLFSLRPTLEEKSPHRSARRWASSHVAADALAGQPGSDLICECLLDSSMTRQHPAAERKGRQKTTLRRGSDCGEFVFVSVVVPSDPTRTLSPRVTAKPPLAASRSWSWAAASSAPRPPLPPASSDEKLRRLP